MRTLSGLPSTSRISMRWTVSLMAHRFFPREGKSKGGSCSGRGFHPDAPAVPLHDLLANRQPDAGARMGAAAVQALEHHENPLEIFRRNTDAVVLHRKVPEYAVRFSMELNLRALIATELDRIGNQVLEQLAQLLRIAHHHRQWPALDLCTAFIGRHA